MVTSVCLNPSIDKTVVVGNLILGATNRVLTSRVDPGGKGINAAVAIRRLGASCAFAGFIHEKDKDLFVGYLASEGVETHAVLLPGAARINLKIHCGINGPITELNEAGTPVEEDDLARIERAILAAAGKSRLLILTGSLPPRCPADFYAALIKKSPAPVILDAAGEALLFGIKEGAHYIKPNLAELEATAGRRLETLTDVKQAAIELIQTGARHVLVSLGERGALLTDGKTTLYSPGLGIKPGSTVGAGDCMVAGLAYAITREKDGCLATLLCMANAAGAAGAATAGTQLLDKKDFDTFCTQTKAITI